MNTPNNARVHSDNHSTFVELACNNLICSIRADGIRVGHKLVKYMKSSPGSSTVEVMTAVL